MSFEFILVRIRLRDRLIGLGLGLGSLIPNQFMSFEFNCRTADNVELVLEGTFFWQARYRRDTSEIWARYGRDMGEIWARYGGDVQCRAHTRGHILLAGWG